MPQIINVSVTNKVAVNDRPKDAVYVCGNSDFVVHFAFDAEWDAFDTKTARFKYNGTHQDIVFTGNECAVPIIEDAHKIEVGVFAGNLHTTTPAVLIAMKSILCGSGSPAAPSEDVYAQIMERLNSIGGASEEDIAAAVEAYMSEHPVEERDPTVHAWAKAENKPTYTADEVGALPIDTEIPAVPTTLPNPHKLTFSGAVSAEYDGSEAVEVVIPQGGGGGGALELLFEITTTEDVLRIDTGIDLNQYNEILAYCVTISSDSAKTTHLDWGVADAANREVRVTNGLHNTQTRCFPLHLIRTSGKAMRAEATYGYWDGDVMSTNSNRICHVCDNLNITSNFYCTAYVYGGTMLKAGTILKVYGR